MGKLLFAVVVAIASFALVESLTCNKCSVSVFGVCLNPANVTCGANETVCYNLLRRFPFHHKLCWLQQPGLQCKRCCRCNPVTLSGAPTTKMSAAITGAVLVSVCILVSFSGVSDVQHMLSQCVRLLPE